MCQSQKNGGHIETFGLIININWLLAFFGCLLWQNSSVKVQVRRQCVCMQRALDYDKS